MIVDFDNYTIEYWPTAFITIEGESKPTRLEFSAYEIVDFDGLDKIYLDRGGRMVPSHKDARCALSGYIHTSGNLVLTTYEPLSFGSMEHLNGFYYMLKDLYRIAGEKIDLWK